MIIAFGAACGTSYVFPECTSRLLLFLRRILVVMIFICYLSVPHLVLVLLFIRVVRDRVNLVRVELSLIHI